MLIINHQMALEPLQVSEKIETKRIGAIQGIAQKSELVSSKLVFDHKMTDGTIIKAGTLILIPGDAAFQAWAKKVYEFQGVKFIQIPEQVAIGMESNNEISVNRGSAS